MGAPAAIDRLGTVACYLADSGHPLAGWLTEVVAMVRLGAPVEAALGLRHGYDAKCRRDARDAALAALAAAFPGSANATGKVIASAIVRHQTRGGLPEHIGAHVQSYLNAGGPTSARSIRLALSELAKIACDPANTVAA